MPLQVTALIAIDFEELHLDDLRPGRDASVSLRFDALHSPALSDAVRARLLKFAARHLDAQGILHLKSQRYRNRPRNRRDVLRRFVHLIEQAALAPRAHRANRHGERLRLLDRGQLKALKRRR